MTTTIGFEELSGFVEKAFVARGVPADDAATATAVIVSANLKGIDTHGVVRLPHYVRRLENGTVKARPRITADSRAPGVAVVDGDDGLGHVVMHRAVDRAVEIAQTVGVASVAVKGSSHFGTAGYYVEELTRNGCAGMVTTSSDAFQAPFGAAAAFFGTNPIAFGFPTSGHPLILDMATTSVPFGKLAL
ncbi:MAG: Ldh family oxidoreductase, partial [Spirochaetota bacterium]